MVTKIFIGGLSAATDEMDIAQLVGPYGDILTIKLVRDKVTRKSKGFAFVEMANRESADLALDALDGQMFKDKELTVNISTEEPIKSAAIYQKVKQSGTAKPKRPRLRR